MNWLTQHITREGPGVPRHSAPSNGLALLRDTLRREWWTLIELNLLYALFCLPVITIPAAHVAATSITLQMLDDRNIYLVRDFWMAFRRCFWRATAFGAVAFVAIGLATAAAVIFLDEARDTLWFALPFSISLATAMFLALSAAYGFAFVAMRDLPLAVTVRLALLGALARPLPALLAVTVVVAFWLIHVALYPASIFMPAVINFSFGTLAVTLGVHKAAARLLASRFGNASGDACAGGNAQPRATKGRNLS